MTFKKKVLALAAAGALTAATAVPALALENEFHGMFRFDGITGNFLTGTSGPGTSLLVNNPTTRTFVDQRARLQYIAKASDDLKLVTHFEIDSRWGDNSYAPYGTGATSTASRNNGGALGADQVNLETKSVYLDFNIPGIPVNGKVGMQPIIDSYKGVLFNADAAGALFTGKTGALTTALGFFRFDDARSAGVSVGKTTRDFLIVDAKYAVNKDLKVGASYYYYNDDKSVTGSAAITAPSPYVGGKDVELHMAGLNAAANFGIVSVDGFVLGQDGRFGDNHVSSLAANVGAKVQLPMGKVKTNFLYTSGSGNGKYNHSFVPVTNETSNAYGENSFYDAGMALLMRSPYGMSNSDQAIVYDNGNRGQGILAGFVGYDGTYGKTFANANAGFMSAAVNNTVVKPKNNITGDKNSSNYMGTEINAEVGYKLYDNMTASVQGAYVFLGDYFKGTAKTVGSNEGTDPTNPWLARILLNYTF